jgi:hypothetical protein
MHRTEKEKEKEKKKRKVIVILIYEMVCVNCKARESDFVTIKKKKG